MALSPVHFARFSQNMRAHSLLTALRLNQRALFATQDQLATGLRFEQPSADPVGAARVINLDRRLGWIDRVKANLGQVNATLNETDSAMQDALTLLTDVQGHIVQATGDTLSADERLALVPVIDAMLAQLVAIGNRKYLNTHLFAGHGTTAPFALEQGGVVYSGDDNARRTLVDTDQTEDSFTIPGFEFFGAGATVVRGTVELGPAVTSDTRIVDLVSGRGGDVQLGRLRVTTPSGDIEIDLRGAATVGDVVDMLNATLPASVRASSGPAGIALIAVNGGFNVEIAEVGGGQMAADLGLLTGGLADRMQPVRAKLTPRTRLPDLNGGAGFNLLGGMVIRNGDRTATLQLDDAQTVEELLNRINESDVGVWARIAADGQRLELISRISGVDLAIEENGGPAAGNLGLRTFHAGTRLSELNGGRGVETVSGGDIRFTTASGATFDVGLAGATTVQDVLNRINTGTGGAVLATLAAVGNGLVLVDRTPGMGAFSVTALNDSPALRDFGLDGTPVGRVLTGRDVHTLRVDGPFTALLELREALAQDDRDGLVVAGQRFDRVLKQMQVVQGRMASRAKSMSDRLTRVEAESDATKALISDVRDVDFSEAAVRFQQLQTALQANLTVAGRIMNLSLLDYLR
jgi:flagellar hook-associated protein 3 FlgL